MILVSDLITLTLTLALLTQAVPSSSFTVTLPLPLSASRVLPRSIAAGGDFRRNKSLVVPLFAAEDNKNPFAFAQGLLSQQKGAAATDVSKTSAMPDCVVDADYTLAAVFAAIGLGVFLVGNVFTFVFGGFLILLATLFAVQATRIRFVFDQEAFELKNTSGDDAQLTDSGENFVVGGANRWAYSSFVNWEFFPKGSPIPVLVYFKETQTIKTDGSNDGQIHFFPAIANSKQLEEQFTLRGCAKIRD